MKTAKFLFMMVAWVALMHGASLGQSGQVSEQKAAESGEKSAPEMRRENVVEDRSEKDQPGWHADQKTLAARSKSAAKNQPAIHSAKPAQSRPVQSANKTAEEGVRPSTGLNATNASQTDSRPSPGTPAKTVKHSAPSVTASNATLNGQQFKNSRSPGAHMASAGGPANSTHSTGAINGSDLKRKP
jgi:hypothetical protein